jgi:ATP-dependent Clp protease ATP-binding subunit ClpA
VSFERFTDRARRTIVLAQEEARTLSHNYIGTEHILLGLIHEGGGVAAQALKALGLSLDDVHAQVLEIIGRGQEPPAGHIPFTPRAKKVCDLSLRESLQLGHNFIGTEHLLLGLIREGEGVAAQILVRLGAELNLVRQEVIKLLSGYTQKTPEERAKAARASYMLAQVKASDAAAELQAAERALKAAQDADEPVNTLRRSATAFYLRCENGDGHRYWRVFEMTDEVPQIGGVTTLVHRPEES